MSELIPGLLLGIAHIALLLFWNPYIKLIKVKKYLLLFSVAMSQVKQNTLIGSRIGISAQAKRVCKIIFGQFIALLFVISNSNLVVNKWVCWADVLGLL